MAAKIEKLEGDIIRLTVGSMDEETESYLVNIHQIPNIIEALHGWQEHIKAGLTPKSITADKGQIIGVKGGF